MCISWPSLEYQLVKWTNCRHSSEVFLSDQNSGQTYCLSKLLYFGENIKNMPHHQKKKNSNTSFDLSTSWAKQTDINNFLSFSKIKWLKKILHNWILMFVQHRCCFLSQQIDWMFSDLKTKLGKAAYSKRLICRLPPTETRLDLFSLMTLIMTFDMIKSKVTNDDLQPIYQKRLSPHKG